METFWFIMVAFMFAVYLVLDGFDLGTGIIYHYVARTDTERSETLAAIEPVWNGNEVWLIAGGGLLFFAFPRAYAVGFSGFYLALIVVLWLLMLRGLAIELRHHLDHPLWKPIWDLTFTISSFFLAMIVGITLGNLMRGVPLNTDGYFFMPLWTTLFPGSDPGILDVYTVLNGILTVTILSVHGANYIAMKTDGDLYLRACRFARVGGWSLVPMGLLNIFTLTSAHPILGHHLSTHPVGYVIPIAALVILGSMLYFRYAGQDIAAFSASSLFILSSLGSLAWALYPNLLLASTDSHSHLTIYNAATSPYGLKIGLVWFILGFSLVLTYTIYIYRAFWGKVTKSTAEESI
ncbi:cytochrome d ubiquinol oxidase subunit II [Nitrospira sp. M1]